MTTTFLSFNIITNGVKKGVVMKKLFKVDNLFVHQLDDAEQMGICAASNIRRDVLSILKSKSEINMMFAAAPSQITTLNSLLELDDIPWNKINAFHMDEYVGISEKAPQSFRHFLIDNLFSKKPFKSINLIEGDSSNVNQVVLDYSQKLKKNKMDIIVLGIGESGHIAFNDPPFAKFNESELVKVVDLSEVSRMQQVHDKCFDSIESVPKQAITVTIPAFFSATVLHCVVPSLTKAKAIKRTLEGDVSEACPATILRKHSNASLYIDSDSASLL